MDFHVDPQTIWTELIGPFGGYLLLGLFFLGFAWHKPWFYFAREIDERETIHHRELESKDKEIADKNDRIKILEDHVTALRGQNGVLLTMAQSTANQGQQAALLAARLAELQTGVEIPKLPDG